MKTTPENLSESYHAAGEWGEISLDGLFRQTAKTHPDRVALADAPDRETWTGGGIRELTYAQADREIDQLAAFYRAVGLAADHVIGIQAPNTVETVIAFLAALRADLIVAPLPLHWRQKDVLSALNSVAAKGFVAADRVETRNLGSAARDVAADLFSLRFVFGLGSDIPDGLIELGPMLAEMGNELSFEASDRADAADQTATICWSRSGGEAHPIARCHNHWLAVGRRIVSECDLADGARMLVPYSLSGLTGLGAGLVPWLLLGGTLHLHHPTSLVQLAKHANAVGADCVLVPGPLVQTLDRGLVSQDTRMLAAWNVASPQPIAFVPRRPVIDLQIADEFALVAKARGPSARAHAIPLGKQPGSNGRESGPALLEIAVAPQADPAAASTLLVKGAMVPDTGWHTQAKSAEPHRDKNGFLDTRIPVEVTDNSLPGFGIPGTMAPGVGDLGEVDRIYAGYPGIREAAAFVVDDSIMGGKLHAALVPEAGTVPDARAFFAYLDAEGVDLAKMPHRVLVLQSLPRENDGGIDRARLTLRTQRMPAAVA